MLHFDFSLKHSKEFWDQERKYSESILLDSILDNLSHDFEIPLKNVVRD
jgi:hypothetical protein